MTLSATGGAASGSPASALSRPSVSAWAVAVRCQCWHAGLGGIDGIPETWEAATGKSPMKKYFSVCHLKASREGWGGVVPFPSPVGGAIRGSLLPLPSSPFVRTSSSCAVTAPAPFVASAERSHIPFPFPVAGSSASPSLPAGSRHPVAARNRRWIGGACAIPARGMAGFQRSRHPTGMLPSREARACGHRAFVAAVMPAIRAIPCGGNHWRAAVSMWFSACGAASISAFHPTGVPRLVSSSAEDGRAQPRWLERKR